MSPDVLRPESEAELAAMIRGATGPLSIRGGNTRQRGFPSRPVIETTGLTGITLYEPAALTLVARAGTPLAEIEALLATEGQMLAFEPPSRRHARTGGAILELRDEDDRTGLAEPSDHGTIGGVIAANASASRRVQVGAARDALIGVRFVDGTGEIVANGGRVMKNVTGYDLVKLMAGSRGRLGVITEVSLKTAPIPRASMTLRLQVPAWRAVEALTLALGGPFDVSGAGWLPDLGALLRLEGLPASVRLRAEALTDALRMSPDMEPPEPMAPEDARAAWLRLGTVAAGWGLEAEGVIKGTVWRTVCRPSQTASLLAQGVDRQGISPLMMDWGGGLILTLGGFKAEPLLPPGAHARRLTGRPLTLPDPDPVTARLEAGLREKFDPRGLFTGAF